LRRVGKAERCSRRMAMAPHAFPRRQDDAGGELRGLSVRGLKNRRIASADFHQVGLTLIPKCLVGASRP